MSGSKILADTNILIYLLNGNMNISGLLADKEIYVSSITEIELLSFPGLSNEGAKEIRYLLNECIIVELVDEVKEFAINLRRKYKILLPDAIVAACALYKDIPLLTADKGSKKYLMSILF